MAEEITKTKEIKKVEVSQDDKKISGTSATKDSSKKKKKEKKERLGFNWFFWISFIIILVPVVYFVYLLYSASQESNVPILGTRLETYIETPIETTKVTEVEKAIRELEGVKTAHATLIVETLRVTITADDELTADQLKQLNEAAYQKVDEIIPVATYFSMIKDKKQYDLEITTVNNLSTEDFKMVVLTRNAAMYEGQYVNQLISEPLNPDLVQQILEEERKAQEEENQQQEDDGGDEVQTDEDGNVIIDDSDNQD